MRLIKSALLLLTCILSAANLNAQTFSRTYQAGIHGKAESFIFENNGTITVLNGGGISWINGGNGDPLIRNKYMGAGSFGKGLIKKSISGGYIMVHEGLDYGFGESDIVVFITDSLGNIEGIRYHGTPGYDVANELCEMPNGDIILTGATQGFSKGSTSVLFLKLNKQGYQITQRCYGPLQESRQGNAIVNTPDSCFLIAGTSTDTSGFIMKTDGDGNLLWTRHFSRFLFHGMKMSADGGLVLTGCYSYDDSLKGTQFLIMKADINGDIQWVKIYGGAGDDCFVSVAISVPSGGIATAGYSGRSLLQPGHACAALTGENGEHIWLHRSDTGIAVFNNILVRGNPLDEDIFLTGIPDTSGAYGNLDFILGRTDQMFNCFPPNYVPESDTGFAPADYYHAFTSDSGILSFFTVCIPPYADSLVSELICTEWGTEESGACDDAVIYPNPAPTGSEVRTGDCLSEFGEVSILDLSGRFIAYPELIRGLGLRIPALDAGVYLLVFRSGSGRYVSRKLVVY